MNDDRELMQKCRKELANPTGVMPKFRAQLLLKCGCAGIKTVGRMFKNMDNDGNRKLNKEELFYGLRDRGIELKPQEIDEIFNAFDDDGSGSIDYEEFLKELREPMSESRLKLVKLAFKIMDVTDDNSITVDDLKGTYNPEHHPKLKSGEWTATQCLRAFLDNFDEKGHADGKVTEEEWTDYYHGVSISVDSDAYFDLMMRQAWGIDSNDVHVGRHTKKAYSNQL